jgi:vacuolar-type H+-ATPase subunit E/Vma4
MKSVEENIELLSRAMLNEAKAEAEQVLVEAQKNADAIRQKAQEKAAAGSDEILERARQEADRLHGQAVATTIMKARTLELERREKLLDGVFNSAKSDIPSIQQWTDYPEIALRLLNEAIDQLKTSKVVVHADAKTQATFTKSKLDEISKERNVEIVFSKTLEKGTGVVVETSDGHLYYDNTLETRLSRLQNSLRSPVYRILIGETL